MKTELLQGLLQYQLAWLGDQSRFKLGLWARQTGKDYTCAAEAVMDCMAVPRAHWLILGCGERQAGEGEGVGWKLRFAIFFGRCHQEGVGDGDSFHEWVEDYGVAGEGEHDPGVQREFDFDGVRVSR